MRDIQEKGQMPLVTLSYNGKKPLYRKAERNCIPLSHIGVILCEISRKKDRRP